MDSLVFNYPKQLSLRWMSLFFVFFLLFFKGKRFSELAGLYLISFSPSVFEMAPLGAFGSRFALFLKHSIIQKV